MQHARQTHTHTNTLSNRIAHKQTQNTILLYIPQTISGIVPGEHTQKHRMHVIVHNIHAFHAHARNIIHIWVGGGGGGGGGVLGRIVRVYTENVCWAPRVLATLPFVYVIARCCIQSRKYTLCRTREREIECELHMRNII